MSWWLFIQLIILIVLVGLVVAAVAENFTDNLYENRDQNLKNERHNWRSVSETPIINGSSESWDR